MVLCFKCISVLETEEGERRGEKKEAGEDNKKKKKINDSCGKQREEIPDFSNLPLCLMISFSSLQMPCMPAFLFHRQLS